MFVERVLSQLQSWNHSANPQKLEVPLTDGSQSFVYDDLQELMKYRRLQELLNNS